MFEEHQTRSPLVQRALDRAEAAKQEQPEAKAKAARIDKLFEEFTNLPSRERYDYDALIEDGALPPYERGSEGFAWLPKQYYKGPDPTPGWSYDLNSGELQIDTPLERTVTNGLQRTGQALFEYFGHGPYTVARAASEFAGLKAVEVFGNMSDEDMERLRQGNKGMWNQVSDEMLYRYHNPPQLFDPVKLEDPTTPQGQLEETGAWLTQMIGEYAGGRKAVGFTLNSQRAKNFLADRWRLIKEESAASLAELIWARHEKGNLSSMLNEAGHGDALTETLDSIDDEGAKEGIKNVAEGAILAALLTTSIQSARRGNYRPLLYILSLPDDNEKPNTGGGGGF